jgi:hypothetical protein
VKGYFEKNNNNNNREGIERHYPAFKLFIKEEKSPVSSQIRTEFP